jgi:1-acyl-sn-glycerol-3-phosphate acyltransferase
MRTIIRIIIYGILLRALLKIIVGVQYKKARFLKKEKQFIIVANHNSHLDTLVLLSSLPWKMLHKVKPVAAADVFAKNDKRARLSKFFLNALLIQRARDKENPENDPIHQMIRELDKGYSLIVFPEGTRGEPEVEQPLKAGIALVLQQRPEIKIVPAYMTGLGNAMPKNDNVVLPCSAQLRFGKPTRVKSYSVNGILFQIENEFSKLYPARKQHMGFELLA